MARKQIGTDYVLFLNTGTDVSPVWKIVLCQTTASVNTPASVIEARSKCGPDTMLDFDVETIEMEGQLLQKDPSDTQRMTYFELMGLYRAGIASNDPIGFKLAPKGETIEDDGKIIHSGLGKITNVSVTYPDNELATVSMSMNVEGQIEETEFAFTT